MVWAVAAGAGVVAEAGKPEKKSLRASDVGTWIWGDARFWRSWALAAGTADGVFSAATCSSTNWVLWNRWLCDAFETRGGGNVWDSSLLDSLSAPWQNQGPDFLMGLDSGARKG